MQTRPYAMCLAIMAISCHTTSEPPSSRVVVVDKAKEKGTTVVPTAWCPAAVNLTESPSFDLTGQANDEKRVLRVQELHSKELESCPGTKGMTVGHEATKTDVLGERSPTDDPPLDTMNYVIVLYIGAKSDIPAKNPMFLDGVRVYFRYGGDFTPPKR